MIRRFILKHRLVCGFVLALGIARFPDLSAKPVDSSFIQSILMPFQNTVDSECVSLDEPKKQKCKDENLSRFVESVKKTPPKYSVKDGVVLEKSRSNREILDKKTLVRAKDEERLMRIFGNDACVTVEGGLKRPISYEACLFKLHDCHGLDPQNPEDVDACMERPIKADRRPYMFNDQAKDLVDNGYESSFVTSLISMEAQGLMYSQLAQDLQPWSDYYWPLYSGVLGYRYADPNIPYTEAWDNHRDFHFITEPIEHYLGDISRINQMSPSEKWDALMGPRPRSIDSLTAKMWEEGEAYFHAYGKVERWMGICHGWAAASYMMPRPVKPVTLRTPDTNQEITLFPSDMKALGSLLWAKGANLRNKFIGGRCNDKDPEELPNGAIKSDKCFDTNPGTWHTAVVNQIGIAKRSFIIDATYDYEVWNQPVISYQYNYFNPVTFQHTNTLSEAAVNLDQELKFEGDRFDGLREINAVNGQKPQSVVGVVMTIQYMVETPPTQNPTDSPYDDGITMVSYMYDLEMSGLDGSGEILGGEWYQNERPDFLWTPSLDTEILTYGDSTVADTTGKLQRSFNFTDGDVIPEPLRRVAQEDGQYSLPTGSILRHIFGLAAKPVNEPENSGTNEEALGIVEER